MKRLLAVISIFILLLPAIALAENEDVMEEVETQLAATDVSAWEESFALLPDEVKTLWGADSAKELVELFASANVSAAAGDDVLSKLGAMALVAVKTALTALSGVIAIALLTGVLNALAEGTGNGAANDAASLACFLVCAVSLSYLITSLAVSATDTINRLGRFIEVSTPVFAVLLSAAGGVTLGGMIQPLMGFLSAGVVRAFEQLVLPLIVAGGAVSIVCGLSDTVKLDKLIKLAKSIVKWVIGAVFSIYTGIVALQGMSVGSMDTLTMRTAKYALRESIPIVGGAVSGALENVIGSAAIIKNAAGAASMLIAVGIALSPLISIGGTSLALRAAAALTEPFSDARVPKLLSSAADMLTYLFAAVVAVGLMFIISGGLVVSVVNP